ncbi:hypothetical protein HY990_01050 [Candidatus Micrarchaeota archaeon]|nr:hypothetical protein [Candidatus Micrarchaeota archaeon]
MKLKKIEEKRSQNTTNSKISSEPESITESRSARSRFAIHVFTAALMMGCASKTPGPFDRDVQITTPDARNNPNAMRGDAAEDRSTQRDALAAVDIPVIIPPDATESCPAIPVLVRTCDTAPSSLERPIQFFAPFAVNRTRYTLVNVEGELVIINTTDLSCVREPDSPLRLTVEGDSIRRVSSAPIGTVEVRITGVTDGGVVLYVGGTLCDRDR